MRPTILHNPFTTTLVLVASAALLSGCGDPGSQLPAGMTGTSSPYTGSSALVAGDPGPLDAGVSSGIDDPVLAESTELTDLGALSSDDPFQRAVSDWDQPSGDILGEGIDDFDLDADLDRAPAYANDGGYGYGDGLLGVAAVGATSTGFVDQGFSDAGFVDGGFDDAGFVDGGFDPGFVDGSFDGGIEDPGFVDGGFDAGFVDAGMDVGFVDTGFDAGFSDAGFVDAGFGF